MYSKVIYSEGMNHFLEIHGNPYKKSEISYIKPEVPFEKEKSRTLKAEVIYLSI